MFYFYSHLPDTMVVVGKRVPNARSPRGTSRARAPRGRRAASAPAPPPSTCCWPCPCWYTYTGAPLQPSQDLYSIIII